MRNLIGGGEDRYALLLTAPNANNALFSRIESYKYGTGAGGKELQLNTTGHRQITMGSHVIPLYDNSCNLDESAHSWYGVYYYQLFAHSMAAFNNNIIDEILAHPPKAQLQTGGNNKGLKEVNPAFLPEALTDGKLILTNNVISYNYQANYQQEVQIKALQKQLEDQQQVIEQLKAQLSEIETLKQQLNKLKNK